MKEELEKLGIELAKLAKKYNQDYLSLGYVNNCVVGNNNPKNKKCINIYIDKEEIEKCLEKQ